MKIKNLLGLGILLGAAAIAPSALANTIVLTQNAYSFSDGGEFTAITTPSMLTGYAPQATLNGGFQTFCVESSVYFWPNTTYNFNLSNSDSDGRNLSLGAAFLYYQFAKGNLAGYDYNNAANRRVSAGMLQSALWMLQGNQSGGSTFPYGGDGNIFYNYAVASLGAANVTAANNGSYAVEIVQLWDSNGRAGQNQLVLNPDGQRNVPDSGATFGLLALSVFGLGAATFIARRSNQRA